METMTQTDNMPKSQNEIVISEPIFIKRPRSTAEASARLQVYDAEQSQKIIGNAGGGTSSLGPPPPGPPSPTAVQVEIAYNSDTFNLENPNGMLKVNVHGTEYEVSAISEKKPIVEINYNSQKIRTNDILEAYVILQYIREAKTLIGLSKLEWDYSKWKVEITSKKDLPSWAIVLNYLLNMEEFDKAFNIKNMGLNKTHPLPDARGWGGERPREQVFEKGFPFYTSSTKKSLKNSERLFECPFPILSINPTRKAVVKNKSTEMKCFTCGTKEGETNCFGNICNFEKGHFVPHINGGAETAGDQCKWCNSFYKDKISWDSATGKPTFNAYAILRDAPKRKVIEDLKRLGFTPEDLK
jgi:hypothetical protein